MPITGLDRMPGSGLARGTLFDKELNVTEIDVPIITIGGSIILEISAQNKYTITWAQPSGDKSIQIRAMDNVTDYFVFENATQTFTNKTLTSPAINTATIIGGTITGITDLDMAVGNRTIFDTIAANTLTIGANNTTISIPGNLTISGTTTTVNTTTLNVADNLFLMNSDFTGSATQDSGFVIERGNDTNVAFVWDESADEFAMVTTNNTGSGNNITEIAYANLQIANLAVAQVDAFTLSGKLTAGSVEIEGSNFDIDGGDVSAITVSGSLTWNAAQNLNSQNLTNVNIDSGSADALTSLTVANDVDVGSHSIRAYNFIADAHTNLRAVLYAGTNGTLTSEAAFTYNDTTNVLTVPKIAAFEAAGAIDFSDEAMTNVNINSGDIATAVVINKSPVITLAGDLSGNATLSTLGNATLLSLIHI